MGMRIADAEPDLAGGYFRSDHFNFAKNGVPAFSIRIGPRLHERSGRRESQAAAYGRATTR
jgi:Zn-dependent M28 family amino/carboxypeptidase